MLELGEYTEKEHRNLVMYAASCGIDVLLCIEDNMKVAVEAAQATSISSVKWFSNKEELADYLVKTVKEDDLILFKASRGIKLEDVLQIFYERYV
jgi:UDP-N-acetylmuramoyl-tripeptide--D-alanyl-D-alanine ligase